MTNETAVRETEFPFAETAATQTLARAFRNLSADSGISMRRLAKELKYKQAVVLSHMATGRTPIPIDRAEEFADILGIDKARFLTEVIRQRHPNVNWSLLEEASGMQTTALIADLEQIAGVPIGRLSSQQLRVMREVAADREPARRWLTVHEVAAMELIRRCRPAVALAGLSSADREAIGRSLSNDT